MTTTAVLALLTPWASGLMLTVAIAAVLLLIGLAIWSSRDRAFESTDSVAEAYDRWTDDQLLERLWGDHVHLGHYGSPPQSRDFRAAKADFVHELVRWSGLDQLPPGSTVLDVGCGIGGSARILARDYGLNVLGISISPGQIQRAQQLTPEGLSCRFAVMNALDLQLADASFDAVWSVEAGPHMPDKQRYADELLRVLKPGGLLAVADWNRRDPEVKPPQPQGALGDAPAARAVGPPGIRQHPGVSPQPRAEPLEPWRPRGNRGLEPRDPALLDRIDP